MKKILFFSIFVSLQLYAANLIYILDTLDSNSKIQSIVEKSKADVFQKEQFKTYEAPLLSASLAHADSIPSDAEDGIEYGVSFSQYLSNPFASSQKERVVNEYTKFINEKTQNELDVLKLNVISAYYNVCISQKMQDKALSLHQDQKKGFEQIHKAYKYGEISKKDVLFNNLDLKKLELKLSGYKRMYLQDLAFLQSFIDDLKIAKPSCNDLIEPRETIELKAIEENRKLKAIEYKNNSAKALYSTYDSAVSSLEYELSYEKELDTKRYTVGFSIPLDRFSSLNEKVKAEQLALSSSYSHEKEFLSKEIEAYSTNALTQLEVLYDEYILIKDDLLPLSKELVNLSKIALLEGEGDMMEYLYSTRSYSLSTLELLEIKKSYYKQLFELYKVADLGYGEKNAKK